MGLPDDYPLPARYNDAYHLTGDGVAVPVVRHIAEHILEPMLAAGLVSVRPVAKRKIGVGPRRSLVGTSTCQVA